MICWITPYLGTGAFGVDKLPDGAHCVDIRALVDKAGNRGDSLLRYIRASLDLISAGGRVVICCDHGISRSNAVAAGVLSWHEGIPFSEAVRRVLSATGNAEIHLDVLSAVGETVSRPTESPVIQDHQRWLLTGGYGYLGTALADSAPRGVELLRPTHSELDLVKTGVAIYSFIREHRVSRVLHLAAPHVGNTNSSFGTALVMLRNVLDACASCSVHLFFPSRWEVFAGHKGQQFSATETTALKPAGVVGDAKYLSESLVDLYVQRSGLHATVLRSGLVCGGGSAPNFLKGFIRRAVAGEVIITHTYKNGAPQLDLLDLDDWISACWKLLCREEAYGVFHCGSGELISTREIADIVVGVVRSASNIRQSAIVDSVANIALDSTKLKCETGWMPRIEIASSIRGFVDASLKEPLLLGV